MEATGRGASFPTAWEKVGAALTARKATIPKEKRRTSAKKVVDATDAEARALFYELKRHGLKYENPNSILAALFVLVAGHSGFRPIELRGATFDGAWLTLPNAKKRPGQTPTRKLNLSEMHEDVRAGVDLLLRMIDHDLSKREFAKWQKCLAGQLERACERIGARVLSLYSFRHVAIASWAAAGLSPPEIALLCGHLSVHTAHTHYARAGVGHKRKAVARAVVVPQNEPVPPAGKLGYERAPKMLSPDPTNPTAPDQEPGFVIEDMPEPVFKRDTSRPALSAKEVRRHLDGLIDPRDPKEIAANIARAQRQREARDAAHRVDDDRDGPASKSD
ncbi:site-specific integrase [Devosia ginsengisoli]|uniref:Site-specific integrase n=1 Tax=Devosia ginsengisoli TaxID=400770 RepID=A0A5B8LUT2_9HYPH|nr:site-specific integrase [Devosia ginsengisoli]QDZ11599.1 site-specific integrase [Devosia ginsengisoli]